MAQYRRSFVVVAVTAVSLLAGCATEFTKIAPAPLEHYTRLGPATGKGCGTLGLFGSSTNFIPIDLNSRIDRAYSNALASVPGATGLVNVTMQENWTWWLLATTWCVTISGEAIK